MAYFPNASAGEVFDRQCMRCKYGEKACPIALVQMVYNYEACNSEPARQVLDHLVSDKGECAMFAMDPEGFLAANDKQAKDEDRAMREWTQLNNPPHPETRKML